MNPTRIGSILALLGLIWLSRSMFRSLVNPVAVLAGSFLAGLLYQQIRIPEVAFGPRAALLIVGGPILLIAGYFVTSGRVRNREIRPVDAQAELAISPRLANILLVFCNLIALAYFYFLYRNIVVDQADVIGGIFYRSAFDAGAGSTLGARLAQLGMYVAAMYVAVDCSIRGFRRVLPAIFVGLAVAQAIVESTKAQAFLILLIFMTVWIVLHCATLSRVRLRAIGRFAVVLVIGGLIFVAVTNRRAGGHADVGNTFAYAYAGPGSALSAVVDGGFNPGLPTYRGVSVGGLLTLFGGVTRQAGLYSQPVRLNPEVLKSSINVFTWYLPMLHDVGDVGTVLVLVIVGALSGALFVRVIRAELHMTSALVAALLLLLFIWAPVVSLTYYNFWFVLLILTPVFGKLFRIRRPDALGAFQGPARSSSGPSSRLPTRSLGAPRGGFDVHRGVTADLSGTRRTSVNLEGESH